jgi:hypothetical protein
MVFARVGILHQIRIHILSHLKDEGLTMSISQTEMMRQLHAYATDEMRNRGLEEAAKLVERQRARSGAERFDNDGQTAAAIRALKTDPSRHMTDWWENASSHSNGVRQFDG